ncbi:MAG TPA: hypothetical protein VKV31_00645 [bacterium]|nr:hypothetical protein [bacterium]
MMTSKDNVDNGFTDEEKMAMAERAREIASSKKMGPKPNVEDLEKIVQGKSLK